MPLYSRHSSDGRDRFFLGDIHDAEEFDQSMEMIFISSNFTDEYKVIIIVQKQMSYCLQAAKKKRLIRQRNTIKNTIVNTTKRSSNNHTCVEFVEKLFPTALISKDTKNLKDSKRCTEAKNNV